jgi:hypothetical protein
MKTIALFLCGLLLYAGCSSRATSVSATASFNPLRNKNLSARVLPLGDIDKEIAIQGTADSDFQVTVGISCEDGGSGSSAMAEFPLQWKNKKLSPLPEDYRLAGGGQRPALRRENDRELTVYYPAELKGNRTWVKFRIVMEDEGKGGR